MATAGGGEMTVERRPETTPITMEEVKLLM
jgi:hypothetical protein